MAIVRRPPQIVPARTVTPATRTPMPVVADRAERAVIAPKPVVQAKPVVQTQPAIAVVPARTVVPQTPKPTVCGQGTVRAGLKEDPTKYEDGGCGKPIEVKPPPTCPDGQVRNAAGKCVPKQANNNAGPSGLNLAGLGLDQKTINQLLGLYGKNTQYNPISSLLNAITNQKEYDLAKAKQDAELAATKSALERATTGTSAQLLALQEQLAGAGVPEAITTAISDYGTNANEAIGRQYGSLATTLQNLYQGEGGTQEAPTPTSALGLTQAGFTALRDYLAANPANTFAQAKAAGPAPAPQIANDLEQYMQSQGVDAGRVQPGLLSAQAAAQGGATNYQNLLNVLAANEASGGQSRQRELELSQTLANAGLGAEYTRQRGALTNQQLAALAQIVQNQGTQTLQAETTAQARRQALQDAILKLQGTGYNGCPEGYAPDPVTFKCVEVKPETVTTTGVDTPTVTGTTNGLSAEALAALVARRGMGF